MRLLIQMSLIIGFATFMACASTQEVYEQAKRVNASDGITREEAKIIAKKQLVSSPEKRYFKIAAPAVWENNAALQYPEYWFVVFGHNWFSPMSTESAKTYTELKETLYLTVIHKETGDVLFTGEYYPKRSANFDWIFHPSVRKADPLNLPAGRSSFQANQ